MHTPIMKGDPGSVGYWNVLRTIEKMNRSTNVGARDWMSDSENGYVKIWHRKEDKNFHFVVGSSKHCGI